MYLMIHFYTMITLRDSVPCNLARIHIGTVDKLLLILSFANLTLPNSHQVALITYVVFLLLFLYLFITKHFSSCPSPILHCRIRIRYEPVLSSTKYSTSPHKYRDSYSYSTSALHFEESGKTSTSTLSPIQSPPSTSRHL